MEKWMPVFSKNDATTKVCSAGSESWIGPVLSIHMRLA